MNKLAGSGRAWECDLNVGGGGGGEGGGGVAWGITQIFCEIKTSVVLYLRLCGRGGVGGLGLRAVLFEGWLPGGLGLRGILLHRCHEGGIHQRVTTQRVLALGALGPGLLGAGVAHRGEVPVAGPRHVVLLLCHGIIRALLSSTIASSL